MISAPAQLLEVMTFNVRYGAAKVGPNRWALREEHALGVIEGEAPAILAVQEALDFQADAILAKNEQFVKVGQHREGGTKNEFSGMFVNGQLLEVEASGDLWLSETPDVIGSVGWGAALTRNATWARFKGKANGKRFVVISTHFDHRGKEARLESAQLLAVERRSTTSSPHRSGKPCPPRSCDSGRRAAAPRTTTRSRRRFCCARGAPAYLSSRFPSPCSAKRPCFTPP